MRKKSPTKLDSKFLISQRLKLQSNQRALFDEFGILVPTQSTRLAEKYRSLDKHNKERFLEILGGKCNLDQTKKFIESVK